VAKAILAIPLQSSAWALTGERAATILTQSSQTTAGPAANLLHPQPRKLWETSSGTTHAVEVDLGVAVAVRVLAMLHHNLPVGATWQARANATGTGLSSAAVVAGTAGSPAWAGTVDDGLARHGLVVLGSAVTWRYWRIEISVPSAQVVRLGGLVIDDGIFPATNFSVGYEAGYDDVAAVDQAQDGSLWPEPSRLVPVWEGTFKQLSATEREGWLQRVLMRGKSRPLLFVPDYADATYAMRRMVYGLLAARPTVRLASAIRFDFPFQIRSMA
jgi:hypothetical protein